MCLSEEKLLPTKDNKKIRSKINPKLDDFMTIYGEIVQMFEIGFWVEQFIKTTDISEFDWFTFDAASECEDQRENEILKNYFTLIHKTNNKLI